MTEPDAIEAMAKAIAESFAANYQEWFDMNYRLVSPLRKVPGTFIDDETDQEMD